MKYFIPQINDSDCGFACLKMLIANLYENKDALYIKQDENHGQYTFKELSKIASEYGIDLQGVEIDNKKEIKKMKFPFIALLQIEENVFHFVLVTKIKMGDVYYLDPRDGENIINLKTFSMSWTGKALIINDFIPVEGLCFVPIEKNMEKTNYLAIIFQILSAAFLITGVFFINDSSKIYFPVLFLGLSLISEIILSVHLRLDLKH